MLISLIDVKIPPYPIPICFDVFVLTCFRRSLSVVGGRCRGGAELSIPNSKPGIAGQHWSVCVLVT